MSAGYRHAGSRLNSPVNMYLYDTLLVVSDEFAGIHVYSVRDAADPRFKFHIPLQGNTGLAVKENIVYANSYGTLLALRIYDDTLYDATAVLVTEPVDRNDRDNCRTSAIGPLSPVFEYIFFTNRF